MATYEEKEKWNGTQVNLVTKETLALKDKEIEDLRRVILEQRLEKLALSREEEETSEKERNVQLSSKVDSLEEQLRQMASELSDQREANKEIESKYHLLTKEVASKDAKLEQLKIELEEMTVALATCEERAKKAEDFNNDKKASEDDIEFQIEKLLYLYEEKNGGEENVPPPNSSASEIEVESSSSSPPRLEVLEKNGSSNQEDEGPTKEAKEPEKIKVSSKDELYKYTRLLPTDPARYGCTLCGKTTKRKTNIWSHVESRHVVPGTFTHECNECHKKVATLTALYTHMHEKHKQTEKRKKKTCQTSDSHGPMCDFSHSSIKVEADANPNSQEEEPQPLERWEEVKNTERKKITSKDDLYNYAQLLPTSPASYRCTLCGKTCRRRVNLWIHVERAHYPGTFLHQCSECDMKLSTLSKLYSHMHAKHQKADKSKRRSMNGGQTKSNFNLDVKVEASANMEPVEENLKEIKSEDLDGEEIRSRDQLYRFVQLSSTAPFAYRCSLCGKTSKQKQNVWKHVENSHYPGTFSYPCKHCPLILSTMVKLNSHTSHKHNETMKSRDGNKNNIDDLKNPTAHEKEMADGPHKNNTKEKSLNKRKVKMGTKFRHSVSEAHKSVFGTRRKSRRPFLLNKSKHPKVIKVEQNITEDGEPERERVTDKKQLFNFIKQSSEDPEIFSCTLCDHKSKRKDNLWLHVESLHFYGTFTHQCNNCTSSFQSMSKLYVHMREENKEKTKRSAKSMAALQKQFSKPKKVKRVESMAEEAEEISSRKPENFSSPLTEAIDSGATDHQEDQTGDDVTKKPMDDKSIITSKDQLYNFIEFSTANPNGYSCTLCGMKGDRKRHLWLHIESIHYPGTFVHTCDHCPDTFTTFRKLKAHLRAKHGGFVKKRKKADSKKVLDVPDPDTKVVDDTKIVEKGLASEDEFYNYIELFQTDPRSYRCTLCGHTSKFRMNLWIHIENIHFPGRFSHQCNQCNLTFPTKTKLGSHTVKTHNSGRHIKRRTRRRNGLETKKRG